MKNVLFLLVFLCNASGLNAQGFKQGDIIVNGNFGGPQITPAILRTALNVYYKANADKNKNEQFKVSISNSGVLNGKTEYGITEDVGIGLAASYWNMNIYIENNYKDQDPVTNSQKDYKDEYSVKTSALALGIRGNYHFADEVKSKLIDPYIGFTLGATRYTYDLGFTSTFPDKKLPLNTYSFKSGWGSYVSTTAGIRFYPVSFIGLNAEIGFDRGAFLFGGIVFKIRSKPPKFLLDDDKSQEKK